jgi:hypothetical protein
MASSMVSARGRASLWLRSRNSRTVLLLRPMAFAFLFHCILVLVVDRGGEEMGR